MPRFCFITQFIFFTWTRTSIKLNILDEFWIAHMIFKPENIRYVGGDIFVYTNLNKFNMCNLKNIIISLLRYISKEK